jgi:hypothetical protein
MYTIKPTRKAELSKEIENSQNDLQTQIQPLNRTDVFSSIVLFALILLLSGFATAQADSTNEQSTQGKVNENSTVSLGIPLGSYPGRGLDLPVSLSYSSTVWNIKHKAIARHYDIPGFSSYFKQSVTEAIYAERSASGWKSSLDLPKIEIPDETYNTFGGQPYGPAAIAGCGNRNRIARIYVHMPGGSTHELRMNDLPYSSGTASGTFYAVDDSRLRFDGGVSDTGTLYLPDGTRYILGHPTSSIIDRNGNTQTYNEDTGLWTDTLGRLIANPLQATPQEGDFPYPVYGINGSTLNYTLKWKKLENALTPVGGVMPNLRWLADHYLPNPDNPITDSRSGNFPQPQSSQYQSLFVSTPQPDDGSNSFTLPTIVIGRGQLQGYRFNPVVLAEVVLPNGTSYKFGYNVYGEMDKVTYPTNAYEKYEYADTTLGYDDFDQPYIQAQRKSTSRKLSINGTGNDILTWTYINRISFQTGGGVIKIIAPDNTRTEIYKHSEGAFERVSSPFGLKYSLYGTVIRKDFYANSAADGTGGQLLRRTLTDYTASSSSFTQSATCSGQTYIQNFSAYRIPRPIKTTNIVFEGNSTPLAQTTTYEYDTTNEMTTGVDQKVVRTYQYVVADDLANILPGILAISSYSTYDEGEVYRGKHILGIKTRLETRDSTDINIVSRSEMVYDEPNYSPLNSERALPTSSRVWDSTKGLVTNQNAYLTTYAKFDNWGNRIEATDAKGNVTITEYDAAHHVFPIRLGPAGEQARPRDIASRHQPAFDAGMVDVDLDAAEASMLERPRAQRRVAREIGKRRAEMRVVRIVQPPRVVRAVVEIDIVEDDLQLGCRLSNQCQSAGADDADIVESQRSGGQRSNESSPQARPETPPRRTRRGHWPRRPSTCA